MPISPLVLQRRHAELGRIRLGAKGDRGQPQKLSQFRITSPSQRYITDLAQLYGGEAREWDNNGKAEWEVYTTATSIPVIAVKGGLSQWMETWSGGGCVHRCDGERTVEGVLCEEDDTTVQVKVDGQWQTIRAHDVAKPTTRLSVMLPELEAIGVWRMESHGWNAAAEIPAVAELAQFVGDLVPANLHLVERRTIRDGRTSRFVVPVLDLQIGTARLKEIVAQASTGAGALEAAPAQQAIEQRTQEQASEPRPSYETYAASATSVDAVREMWQHAKEHGFLDDELKAVFTARVDELKAAAEPVTAEVVAEEEPPGWVTQQPALDVDTLWQSCVAEAGKRGWSLPALEGEFEGFHAIPVAESTAEQMQAFLHALQTGQVAA